MINCEIQGIDKAHIDKQLDELNAAFADFFMWTIDRITDLEIEENYEKAAEIMKEYEDKKKWVGLQFNIWAGTSFEESEKVFQDSFDYVYAQTKKFKKEKQINLKS